MKRLSVCVLLSALLALFAPGTALAKKGSDSADIDQRLASQAGRIQQGVDSGQLTVKEAETLRDSQRSIEKREAKMLQDGKLSPNERKQLNHLLDVQSDKIKKLKTNKQTR